MAAASERDKKRRRNKGTEPHRAQVRHGKIKYCSSHRLQHEGKNRNSRRYSHRHQAWEDQINSSYVLAEQHPSCLHAASVRINSPWTSHLSPKRTVAPEDGYAIHTHRKYERQGLQRPEQHNHHTRHLNVQDQKRNCLTWSKSAANSETSPPSACPQPPPPSA